MRPKIAVILVNALAVVVLLFSLSAAAAGPPGGLDVEVTNDSGNPVPVEGSVEVEGDVGVEGDVNVTNTPDVNVANEPNVNVTNVPGVTVENTAGVNVQNTPTVEVTSSELDPVVVRDVSDDAESRELIRGDLASINPEDTLTVPPGRVVTDILADVTFFEGDPRCNLSIREGSGGPSIFVTRLLEEGLHELHLESGLDSGMAGLDLVRITTDCRFNLLYTGYVK